jgi:hypothetical protein
MAEKHHNQLYHFIFGVVERFVDVGSVFIEELSSGPIQMLLNSQTPYRTVVQ